MIRLLFLIAALNRGGAERQLTLLVNGLDRTRFAVTVVTIYDGGALRGEIEDLEGVEVLSLHKHARWDIMAPFWRLTRILRRTKPQIVHGYMGVANILALMFGKTAGSRVVWGIRASDVDFSLYDRRSAWIDRLAAKLSRFTDLIVVNSHAGKRHHAAQGYSSKRMVVIPNGFDTRQFYPDERARQFMRNEWGIAENDRLIGLVARLDPIKDYPTFLRAAALLAQERQDVHFVSVGGGSTLYRRELQKLANDLGLGDRVIWAGERTDMCAAHNALDIATSSSSSEGFSNTTGEAMACGVPCVVTDVGDSAILVGSTGLVVPPGEPAAMAAAWTRLLDMPAGERAALGRAARQRIIEEYSIEQLVDRTEAALAGLIAEAPETRTSSAD
jgi:glycosyltransferase involved in cell wall biosynthesis